MKLTLKLDKTDWKFFQAWVAKQMALEIPTAERGTLALRLAALIYLWERIADKPFPMTRKRKPLTIDLAEAIAIEGQVNYLPYENPVEAAVMNGIYEKCYNFVSEMVNDTQPKLEN